MKHYEVTFIVDPVLSGDEIKATEQVYETMLKDAGYKIKTSSWGVGASVGTAGRSEEECL
jgi:ribosomal protein S6